MKAVKFIVSLMFLADFSCCFSQITPPSTDTMRMIRIIRSKYLREITIDSLTRLEILSGNVYVQEGNTKFECDSAVINKRLNVMEAFGRVQINQGDSLFTSSQYLKYQGNERMAYLKKNVRLSDKKGGSLVTQELEYDLRSGIGKYHNGGKVINGKTTLTSKEGIYYEDTRDVFFKGNVDMVDPKYKIKADSLMYNMQFEKVTLIGPTKVTTKEATIFTSQGTYDLKKGNAFFGNRTLVKDSSGRTYQANNMAMEEKSGIAQLEGNAIIRDSANNSIVTGGEIYLARKTNSFLATKKPVWITWQKKTGKDAGGDTTYISGDTLFSGYTKRLVTEDILLPDSARHDSLNVKKTDTLVKVTKSKNVNTADTSIRYFIAYHHVKIFNDSLQSVSDSLFYSGADSVFRLFYEPVIWSGKSQVTGDTIFLFTKNKKAERIYVFENGVMINRVKESYYNQVSGKTINGYFKNGEIENIKVKGSPAESIYFLQDKDSAFSGMNRADGSVIEMFFLNSKLDKVKFLNDIHGKVLPMRQISAGELYLKEFNWLDAKRPKNKLELFE